MLQIFLKFLVMLGDPCTTGSFVAVDGHQPVGFALEKIRVPGYYAGELIWETEEFMQIFDNFFYQFALYL